MENIKEAPFKFRDFLVQNYMITRSPEELGDIDYEINPSGIVYKKRNRFQLNLELSLKDSNSAVKIEMMSVAIFSYDNADDSTLGNYFFTNAPALMFPYVRAYISTVTALSGLSAINLPTLNLEKLRDVLVTNIIEDLEEEEA